MTHYETVGRRIHRTRLQRGLTQVELAAALDVTQVSISQWERGVYMPRDHREALATVLEVPRATLFKEIES